MPPPRNLWPPDLSVDGQANTLLSWPGTDTADRLLRWSMALSSVLLTVLPSFWLNPLRNAVIVLSANLAAYGASEALYGTAAARLATSGCYLALAAVAGQDNPLYFTLVMILPVVLTAFASDRRASFLSGGLVTGGQLLHSAVKRQSVPEAFFSIALLAGLCAAAVLLASILRRQMLRVIQSEARAAEMESELESARQHAGTALRIKHDMLANLSHEIRTPLNGVLGMTRLLMDTRLSGEQRELTNTLERSTTALLDIMNEVLDFSALESGRTQLDPQRFEFHRPFEEVVELLGPLAQGKGIELLSEFDPTVPLQVVGDARRLRQVLLNLTGNALKFTESGHILIRTGVEEISEEEIVVRTEVLDTGPGISQEDQGRIFQPFAQGKTPHAGRYGGAGLGLTISKRLVEMMRGDIGFKSSYGRGTRFWFTVRCRRVEDESFPDTSPLSGQRVLALSRNPASAGVAASQMRLWGIDAFAASQPDAALAELIRGRQSGRPYDIVLLDGETAGPMSAGSLLERVSAVGRIPSVGVVPLGNRESEPPAGAPGFDTVALKPLRPSQLWKALMTARFGPDTATVAPVCRVGEAAGASGTDRILLVEDNPINQKVALRMLEKLGYAVDVAANGRFALEMMTAGAGYRAVLMDCMMPEMDGFEATREIREREHGGSRIPVIALTAHALQAERDRCLRSGMDDYITKPVHLEVLRQTLERWAPRGAQAKTQAGGHG
ncbi:MAG: response regulator [Bryobacterales bacterium]|nr:response regulator [Bryobacterales bacterium]